MNKLDQFVVYLMLTVFLFIIYYIIFIKKIIRNEIFYKKRVCILLHTLSGISKNFLFIFCFRIIIQMTADMMTVPHILCFRNSMPADLHAFAATRMELASLRRVGR